MSKLPHPQRPDGISGRLFGILMKWLNFPSYRTALSAANLQLGSRLLEIGFGTGAFLELVAKRYPETSMAGIDPSETMCRVATRRLGRFPGIETSEIRLGIDHPLPWPDKVFNTVVAIYCFQFW